MDRWLLQRLTPSFALDIGLLSVLSFVAASWYVSGAAPLFAIGLALFLAAISVVCHWPAGRRLARIASELARVRQERERLEIDVHESDERVRAILKSLQTGVLLIDAETHVIEDVNRAAAATIGRSREEIIGNRCHRCVCPACEGSCPITDLEQRVDNSERVLLKADGTEVPILKTVVPITLEGRAYLLESFVDLSDREKREHVLQAQLDLSVTLSYTSSLEDSLSECLSIILRGLNRESGGIFLATPDGRLTLTAWQRLSKRFADTLGRGAGRTELLELVVSGEPVYLPASELPATICAACEREGLGSVALVPIHSAGDLVACVLVASHRLKEMPSWLCHGLETMARHLGQTIARLEGEHALRDAHTELDQILQAAAPLSVVDAEGRLLRVNANFGTLFGVDETDLVGKGCCELLPCTKCRRPNCPTSRVATSGESATVELEKRAPDGRLVPCIVTVSPFRDSRGEITGVVQSYHDISAIKQAEGELRKLHQAVHQASSTIVITDPEGRIEYVNPQFCRITGYSLEEVMGQNPRLLKSGEQDDEVYRELWRTISSGREWHGELRNRRKDGSLYWEDVSISPVFDERGAIVNYLAVKDDITDRKRTETELKGYAQDLAGKNALLTELAAAAERANEAKTQFLANMSHELRTPLHGILSFATFGIKKCRTATKDKLLEYFQFIAESGESLHALLDDLLDLARLESGRAGATFGRADLHSLAGSVIDENRALATRRGITVALSPRECSMDVRVDAMKIKQVLRNLLVNAVKFSPDNSEIEVEIRRDGKEIVVAVADRGIGIPEEELEAIFDKFIQSSKTRTGAGGTGLGLAICREIISVHRGRIWAETRPGGGAVVAFRIPMRRPDHDARPHDVSPDAAAGEDGPSTILETADAGSI